MKKVLSVFLCVLMVCMCGVVAMAENESPVIEVESVSLDKSSLTMNYGETAKLIATVNPYNAPNKNVTWSSSDSKIVSVDGNGKLIAAKDSAESPSGKKSVTITVTSVANPNAKAYCVVTVGESTESIITKILNVVMDLVKKAFGSAQSFFQSDALKEIINKVVEFVKTLLGSVITKPADPV